MLYEIPDGVKNNITVLLSRLCTQGINLEEVEVIHEVITVLSNPIEEKE